MAQRQADQSSRREESRDQGHWATAEKAVEDKKERRRNACLVRKSCGDIVRLEQHLKQKSCCHLKVIFLIVGKLKDTLLE